MAGPLNNPRPMQPSLIDATNGIIHQAYQLSYITSNLRTMCYVLGGSFTQGLPPVVPTDAREPDVPDGVVDMLVRALALMSATNVDWLQLVEHLEKAVGQSFVNNPESGRITGASSVDHFPGDSARKTFRAHDQF